MIFSQNNNKIGLLTPYDGRNLGDGAIQAAVIENIKRRQPEAVITGFSIDPENTEKIHGIPYLRHSTGSRRRQPLGKIAANDIAIRESSTSPVQEKGLKSLLTSIPILYPILRKVKSLLTSLLKEIGHVSESYKALKKIDILVASGGGQIDDFWGGPWDHPYTLFKWAVISKLTGTRFLFLSVGLCSLSSPLSRLFMRWTLNLADYRSYRDEVSKNHISSWKFTTDDPVFPDLAFSLANGMPGNEHHTSSSSTVVGINPMVYCHPQLWPVKDAGLYSNYIAKLAELCEWLVSNNHHVTFFSSSLGDREAIDEVATLLQKKLDADLFSRVLSPPIQSVSELLACIAGLDLVVATRLHSVILPFLFAKPVVAISYDRKVATQMMEMGQGEYCLDIENFDTQLLIDKYRHLCRSRAATVADLTERTNRNRLHLQVQYDGIFGSQLKNSNI